MKPFKIFIFAICISYGALAQNTLTLKDKQESPKADLGSIAWMAGHWKGEAFGGITEEVWTPPLGGSMMCTFKLVVNNEVNFYEIVTITEEEGTLMLRLKHFHSNLKGWEEKDETVDFKLVKVTEDRVYFEGFTFERVSDDEVNLYVVINEGEGKVEEVKFNYKKVG
ncbi:DUF6265 family protein [Aureisphaera galaxeae]|uniref:DUF6265 family protein n=1 Tax=Aureisphaera galaxeae TaxID=1538023 RepID=UPI0023500A0A|nr:DUF6265 family protein [Aureisphaera galaxeae]MDC8003719.1 DUF6265 family protein [Aureisphaera galaxeae]